MMTVSGSTIPCLLHAQAMRNGDAPALVTLEGCRSFADIDRRCACMVRWLRETAEIGPGDRIAVVAENRPEWLPLLFAGLRLGAVMCPLNVRQPPAVLAEQLTMLAPSLVITDRELPGFRGSVRDFARLLEAAVVPEEEVAVVREGFPATRIFTSGSRGAAKVVEHLLIHYLISARSANQIAPLGSGDRWLCSLPLYHVGGIAILFRCVLAGAAVGFSGEESDWTEIVEPLEITHLSLVPTQLRRWMKSDGFAHYVQKVKRVLMGGASMPMGLLEEAEAAGLPVAVSYGMTETGSQIAATPPGEPPLGAGRILPHAGVRISESGEIQVQAGSIPETLLTDGWLRTGDCGRLEGSLLFVEGRMDRQFISGGENIQPERIERELQACSGAGCAVVVPVEDAEFGQRPAAWLDVEITDEKVTLWNQALRSRLPGYMIPVKYKTLPPQAGLKPDVAGLEREMGGRGSEIGDS
ncbi:MAG: AMP-binding protein [Kiritimatiellia bacterium]